MNKILSIQLDKETILNALIGALLIIASVSFRPLIIVAILFCTYVACFSNDDIMPISCLACWMNLAPVFKTSLDGASFYTYIVILYALKRLIKNRLIDKDLFLIVLIYACYLVQGMGIQIAAAIKNALLPLQLYTMAMCMDYKGLKRVSGFFILGIIIESTAATFNSLIPNLSDFINRNNAYAVLTNEGYVPQTRFSGLWEDPNYYSIHLLIGILICILLYSRKEIDSLVFYSVVAVLTFFGAKTLSKSFILMLAVALGYAYILFVKNKQYGSVTLMSLVLVILIVLIATGVIDVFSMIMERLKEGMTSGEGLTTGRTGLWKDYIMYFYSHPKELLFGGGLSVRIPFRRGPHNAYLELILFIGIIGSFIFCISVFNAVSAAWGLPIRGTPMPLLFTLIMYFFLGMYNSLDLQFELLLVLGYLWLNKSYDLGTEKGKEGDRDRNKEINLNC